MPYTYYLDVVSDGGRSFSNAEEVPSQETCISRAFLCTSVPENCVTGYDGSVNSTVFDGG